MARLEASLLNNTDLPVSSIVASRPALVQRIGIFSDKRSQVGERFIFRTPVVELSRSMDMLQDFYSGWNKFDPLSKELAVQCIREGRLISTKDEGGRRGVPPELINQVEVRNPRVCFVVFDTTLGTTRIDIAARRTALHKILEENIHSYRSSDMYPREHRGRKKLYSGHVADVKLNPTDPKELPVTMLLIDNMYGAYNLQKQKTIYSPEDIEIATKLRSLGIFAITTQGDHPMKEK